MLSNTNLYGPTTRTSSTAPTQQLNLRNTVLALHTRLHSSHRLVTGRGTTCTSCSSGGAHETAFSGSPSTSCVSSRSPSIYAFSQQKRRDIFFYLHSTLPRRRCDYLLTIGGRVARQRGARAGRLASGQAPCTHRIHRTNAPQAADTRRTWGKAAPAPRHTRIRGLPQGWAAPC